LEISVERHNEEFEIQVISSNEHYPSEEPEELIDFAVEGDTIRWTLFFGPNRVEWTGALEGDFIVGELFGGGGDHPAFEGYWTAARSSAAVRPTAAGETSITIELAQDNPSSRATRDQLLRLLESHDLSKWIETREIVIDSSPRTFPHSHPVLTLSTRHVEDDELLLATFIHEQQHWAVLKDREKLAAATAELRELFPDLPVGYPEGAGDEASNYMHLVVNYLEFEGVRELLGELRARWVIDFWTHDHYRTLYQMLLDRGWEIGRVVRKHGLVPSQ